MALTRLLAHWLGRDSWSAPKPYRFRPAVEGLETRWNPANVTASVANGILTLTATPGANDDKITIANGSVPGQLDLTGTAGTTVNGNTTETVKGVRSIVAYLKGGNDTLTFGAYVKGNITFNGGGGTNELALNPGWIGGSVRYLNGSALANDDNLTISGFDLVIGRNVIADFGEGTSQAILSGAVIGGKVAITAGSGADIVSTNGLSVSRSFTASLGDGDNFVGVESATDNISGTGSRTFLGGALFITTGSGSDIAEIGQEDTVDILGIVSILTGSEATGGDTVTIDNTAFSASLILDLGGGNDQALFETVDTLNSTTDIGGTLTVLGRGGNDTIAFGQASGQRSLWLYSPPILNGGGGTDALLLINVRFNNVLVDALPKLGSTPLYFESIVI